MSKKINKAIPYLALIAASSAAIYSFLKTYKTVKSLEEIDLDLGNDIMLSSLFGAKDNS